MRISRRVKITISYDGSKFQGFQFQKNTKNTISNTLNNALKDVGIFDQIKGSGRTDKGVHATNQVIHIDLPEYWVDKYNKLQNELNYKLDYIYIKSITPVSDDFHSRYDATKRTYRYLISTKENIFLRNYVCIRDSFDLDRVHKAMKLFEGIHDFEYFKKNGSDTTNYVREIYKAYAYEYKDLFVLHFEANGFLRSQIRLMVGFLLQISEGILSEMDLKEQLDKIHMHSTKLSTANGLYLSQIKY